MSNTFMKEASNAYQTINHQWLWFHYRILILCVGISMILEVAMFFIIRYTGTIYDDAAYWLKYIIAPVAIGLLLVGIASYIIRNKRIKQTVKSYALSILLVMIALNLSFMHSGYIAVLNVAAIPILMTIMYEDQRLTACIFILCILLQLFAAFTTLWDPYKEINHSYMINLILILITTSVIYLVSVMMIRFALMKKRIIIQRDVERQQLKVKVHVDELTKVGNKLALLHQLEVLQRQQNTFYAAMMDIDDFKKINDQNGHLFGDEVLKSLGICLKEMGDRCQPYRYGGDEFCIIFQMEDEHKVQQLIEDLQSNFNYTCKHRHKGFAVTISAGIAKYVESMEPMELLKLADDALYEAKNLKKQQK